MIFDCDAYLMFDFMIGQVTSTVAQVNDLDDAPTKIHGTRHGGRCQRHWCNFERLDDILYNEHRNTADLVVHRQGDQLFCGGRNDLLAVHCD